MMRNRLKKRTLEKYGTVAQTQDDDDRDPEFVKLVSRDVLKQIYERVANDNAVEAVEEKASTIVSSDGDDSSSDDDGESDSDSDEVTE